MDPNCCLKLPPQQTSDSPPSDLQQCFISTLHQNGSFQQFLGQATQEIQGSEWWHPFVCRELINPTVYRRDVLQSAMSCKDNLTSLQRPAQDQNSMFLDISSLLPRWSQWSNGIPCTSQRGFHALTMLAQLLLVPMGKAPPNEGQPLRPQTIIQNWTRNLKKRLGD